MSVKIGLDGSTTSSGISVLTEDNKLIDYYCIKPKSKDWEERIGYMYAEIDKILKKYKPNRIIMENVPLKDGKITIVKLACVRGMVISCAYANNVPLIGKPVNQWRKDIGFYDGTRDGLKRDAMKKKAIAKVKELYDIDVNDDIAESILIAYTDDCEVS